MCLLDWRKILKGGAYSLPTNIEIVAATYACGKAGDFAGFVKDFAPDVRWTEMQGGPYAGTYTGAEEIVRNVFTPMNKEWAPFACAPEKFYEDGDAVLMVGRYFGTNLRTGRAFEARVVHCWKLRDGKVVSFEQFTDTAQIAAAMQ